MKLAKQFHLVWCSAQPLKGFTKSDRRASYVGLRTPTPRDDAPGEADCTQALVSTIIAVCAIMVLQQTIFTLPLRVHSTSVPHIATQSPSSSSSHADQPALGGHALSSLSAMFETLRPCPATVTGRTRPELQFSYPIATRLHDHNSLCLH